MTVIAILYGKEATKSRADEMALAFKEGMAVVAKNPRDLPGKPIFTYTMDQSHVRHLVTHRCRYLLDEQRRMVRTVPYLDSPYCSLYVTVNQRIASSHDRAYLQQRGCFTKQVITQAQARAQLPVSIGKWIFIDTFDSGGARTLFKRYKNSGYTFVTVGAENSVLENPKRITVQDTGEKEDDTLWLALMACDLVVPTQGDRRIYHACGRQVARVPGVSNVVNAGFPIDLNDATAQMALHNYVARTKRIIIEGSKFHPLGDQVYEYVLNP